VHRKRKKKDWRPPAWLAFISLVVGVTKRGHSSVRPELDAGGGKKKENLAGSVCHALTRARQIMGKKEKDQGRVA